MTDVDIPDEIEKLLRKEKRRDISEEERLELFSFLEDVKNIKELTMDEYGFNRDDYDRMMKAKRRAGSRQRAAEALDNPGGKLKTEESGDFKDFLVDWWSDARDIGTTVVQKYAFRASEMGYFDEGDGKLDMKGFVEDALEHYAKVAPKMEGTQQAIVADRALAIAMSERYQRNKKKMMRIAMSMKQLVEKYPQLAEEIQPILKLLPRPKGGERIGRKQQEEE